ncbi:MAG: hypothetical protein ACREJ3_14970, partial [Polyangiaceae bacterium]
MGHHETFPSLRLAGRIGGTSMWDAVSEFPPFAHRPGPTIAKDEIGISSEVSSGLDFELRFQMLGAIYAWGKASVDWASSGSWQVRWQSPWGGWKDARSSATSTAPWPTFEDARRALGSGYSRRWTLTPGADADHALLVSTRISIGPAADLGAETVMTLESDRAPVVVKPVSWEPFPRIEAGAQIGGQWVLASAQFSNEAAATILWGVDGANAHELGRVPRLSLQARAPLRLAWRKSGEYRQTLGLIVEGQAELAHGLAFWVTSFDPGTGAVGEPASLGQVDLSNRSVMPCADMSS